jgi:hypothetical protein
MVFHSAVPITFGHLGSLLEAFLPWLGLAVVMLLVLALLRRSATALVALLLPVAVWADLFGGPLLSGDRGAHDITAIQHNVSDENTAPARTAQALVNAGPELIALEELTPSALPLYERALAPAYPHHAVEGSVGLWSVYPLADVRLLDIRPRAIDEGWRRGLRVGARTPWGEVAVYVVHLPSVRVRLSGFRLRGVASCGGCRPSGRQRVTSQRLGGQVLFGPDDLAVRCGAGPPPAGQLSDEVKTAAVLVEGAGMAGAWVAGVGIGDFAGQNLVLDEP